MDTSSDNGGHINDITGVVGFGINSSGHATVGSGLWASSGTLMVGRLGSHASLSIQTGGQVTTDLMILGSGSSSNAAYGSSNTVEVTGNGSTLVVSGNLILGSYGSNNTLAIEDSALVKVGDATGGTLLVSVNGGSGNYLLMNGGYIALFGDQTDDLASLIAAGNVKIWDGSAWVASTDLNDFNFAYFATDEEAQAFSGYSDLGGYTILTSVPEPSAFLLVGLGLTGILFRRRLSVG